MLLCFLSSSFISSYISLRTSFLCPCPDETHLCLVNLQCVYIGPHVYPYAVFSVCLFDFAWILDGWFCFCPCQICLDWYLLLPLHFSPFLLLLFAVHSVTLLHVLFYVTCLYNVAVLMDVEINTDYPSNQGFASESLRLKCLKILIHKLRDIPNAWTAAQNPSPGNHLSTAIHHIITDWFLSNITPANVHEHGPSGQCHYCRSFAR